MGKDVKSDQISNIIGQRENLIPCDGILEYWPNFFEPNLAMEHLAQLREELAWAPDECWMFGKKIQTKRLVALHGDPGLVYTYSGSQKPAWPWSPSLAMIKAELEAQSGAHFNACLANWYQDGTESMGWHSDNEKTLVPQACIASLSLGASRPFEFKHQSKDIKVQLILENGSLLLMKGAIQAHWKHQLPKRQGVRSPRLNLTFRQFKVSD